MLKLKPPAPNLYTLAGICEAPKSTAKPPFIYKQTARALLPLQRHQVYGVCVIYSGSPCLYNNISVRNCALHSLKPSPFETRYILKVLLCPLCGLPP